MIDHHTVHRAIVDSGFRPSLKRNNLYLSGADGPVMPAFVPNITRRKGRAQIGGGVGIYLDEFEEIWRSRLNKKELSLDNTLPLILSVDNFIELLNDGIFRGKDNYEDLKFDARCILAICEKLPNSISDLEMCFDRCAISGKKVCQYVHYFSDIDKYNLYFSKSASFYFWMNARWPSLACKFIACLDKKNRDLILRNNKI